MFKLMLLGGSRYALPVIKAAQNLGVYVITADYLPDNIAHKFSNKYCNVSIVNKDLVLKKAQELQIDGILSFACDPGVTTAAYVAEKMNLPSPGPYESICILQNKAKFRNFLLEHGFNVPKAKGYKSIELAIKDEDYFNYPVIVKPTDSAGSKGVTRLDNKQNLRSAIEFALSFSLRKEFIIEEFIVQKGFSSDSDCFSVDGKLSFVSFNSQRFDQNADNPYTPAAFSWPSSYSEKQQEELTNEIQRLLTLLKMNNSIYNIETREGIDGKLYIMECSPRGGGNRLAECLEYATGIKLIENSIRAALGMELVEIKQKKIEGWWAEIILHTNSNGSFEELWVSDDIKDCIVEKDIWISKKTVVKKFSAANYSIGTLILRFTSKEQMLSVMSNIDKHVKLTIMPNNL